MDFYDNAQMGTKRMTATIKVIDNLAPEDSAMLQALYSRSPASVTEHLERVGRVGSGRFMDTYYVGYGHASIGDCGTTTIFVENVSMLAAKAIQDWPLYSGQEASTRYMDFSTAVFENPLGTPEGEAVQERWRAFYVDAMPDVQEHLRQKYPLQKGEDELVYRRAIAAKSFDIMRAFLPAGAHTNLSWTTNLRQASDKLSWLKSHPDDSVKALARGIEAALCAKYPHSFKAERPEISEYKSLSMSDDYFLERNAQAMAPSVRCVIDESMLKRIGNSLSTRPRGAEVPPWLAEIGMIQSTFALDFGSFRDLQRHRNGTIRMPMLTMELGFHPWYIGELPPSMLQRVGNLLLEQQKAITALHAEPVEMQNYVAMGYVVPCRVTQSFPAYVYRLELRSSKTVHPTLRQVIHREIAWFKTKFPNVALHVDMDEDSWTLRRGKQTIEAK
jgi:hypothetical protein